MNNLSSLIRLAKTNFVQPALELVGYYALGDTMIDTNTVAAPNLTKPSTLRTIDRDASYDQELEGINFKPDVGTKIKNPVKLIPFVLMHIACLGILFVDF